jgi:hypothetical protein
VPDHIGEHREAGDPLEDVGPPLDVQVERVEPSGDPPLVRGGLRAGIRLGASPLLFQLASSPVSFSVAFST